jgi:hypothetical protein
MAKKIVSDKQMRQMMASRQERVGGRFGGLKPEFKTPPVAAAKTTATSDAAVAETINFLQAMLNERKAMGIETSELEEYVVGTAQKQGVRSVVETFIAENREQFNQDDPAGAAAYELMKEAVVLSEASMKASFDDAKKIYAQLKFIRQVAAKAKGKNAAISAKMEEIIAPVEAQLKKRTSFAAFIKDKAESFKKTLPERLAAKVPVVGGLLSGFLRDKREAQESIEMLSGRIQENVSRGGQRGTDLDIGGVRQPRRGGGTGIMGGTRASDIPGLDLGGAGKGIPSTLGAIYKEVVKIRTLIEGKFSPVESDAAELKAREAELEGKTGGKALASQKAVKTVMNGLGAGAGGGGGGFLSSVAANTIGSVLGSGLKNIGPWVLGALGGIGTSIISAIGGLGAAIAAIGVQIVGTAIPLVVSAVGAAIGGGLAWLINSGIDSIFGTNLSEIMLQSDTYTGEDIRRENKIEMQGRVANAKIEAQRNTPEYVNAMSQDPRMLPKLIADKRITGSQALDILSTYEEKNGKGEDTDAIRARILKADPSAVTSVSKNANFAAVNAAQSATASTNISSPASTNIQKSDTTNTTSNSSSVENKSVETNSSSTMGIINSSPSTTTAGRTLNQYVTEQTALNNAQIQAAAGTATPAGTVNNSSVNTRVSNVVNNFNDDLRIRNNEPTQKQMQTFSLVP